MTISFQRNTDFTERRRQGRAPLEVEVFMRERGRSSIAARLVDLTAYGARIHGAILVSPDAQAWIRLPGLESLSVRPVWRSDSSIGVEFDSPLHPAVAARFLPAVGSHGAAALTSATWSADPLLSRREQIMAGIAGSDHSPLQRKKQPSGMGMLGRIARTVSRQTDTRAEQRYGDAIPEGTTLVIEGVPVRVLNVSPSGMKVRGEFAEREIGEKVAVAFEGFDGMTGQLVWRNGEDAGIALPPQAIELFDRAAG